MIKILFINAVDSGRKIELHYPPLGIAYLVSALRKRFGKDIKCKMINSDVNKNILEFRPDIIGISCVSKNYSFAKEYADLAKTEAVPVIIGGYHISALPQTLTENMDIGVMGEGEVTMCELVDLFMRTGSFEGSELKKIDGIVYRSNGNIKTTKRRELIKDLDELPLPARDIFKKVEDAYMFTGRGCPYNCIFCASTRFWAGIRYFSAEYVFNEIKHLVEEYKIRHIHFYDDIFIANKRRIRAIINLLEMHGYLGRVTFSCQARANLVDEEVGQLLKEMGFKGIGMGLESGNEKTLKYLKGDATVENNNKAVNILKKYIRSVHGSFIIGAPKETREEILETLEFIKKSKLDSIRPNVLTPLPDTPLWEYAKSRSLVSDDMDWKRLDFDDDFNYAIILSETLSKEELRELFEMFKKQGRKMRMMYLIKNGLRHPLDILNYLRFRKRE